MTKGLISNAVLVLPDGIYPQHNIYIENDIIAEIDNKFSTKNIDWHVNLEGDYLIPGLIDIHIHGAGGSDIMDASQESLNMIRKTLLQDGTIAFCATTMSSTVDNLEAVFTNILNNNHHTKGAEILGIHLEGPFLSPQYKGAQALQYILQDASSDTKIFSDLINRYPNLIKIITFSVERPSAQALASLALRNNIIPSVGHSAASYEEMQLAINWGIHHVTHAFNAMPGIHHRNPGLLTAALLDPNVGLELIADGIHLHSSVIDLALRLKPPDKIYLISDGTRAVGMPNGIYELGGHLTTVKDGKATLSNGTLAGSACPLMQGLRTLVQKLNIAINNAVNFTCLNPAKLLHVDDRLGSIAIGKKASLVRLSSSLEVRQVWLNGTLAIERS